MIDDMVFLKRGIGAYFGESKEVGEIMALIEIVIHYFGTYRAARLYNKYFIITLIFPRCTSIAYVFATI